MARCPHELKEILSRRCGSCYHPSPYDDEEYEVTRETIVSPRQYRCRHCNPCSCCGYSSDLFHYPMTTVATIRSPNDPSHSTLDGWFRRYCRSTDGFLNLDELRALLHHKGASLSSTKLRKMFDESDVDNDGRLSFDEVKNVYLKVKMETWKTKHHPKLVRTQAAIKKVKSLVLKENPPAQRFIASKVGMSSGTFLHMWHHAAAHEEEFLSSTDCHDMIDIIKSYDLHPRVPCSRCFPSFHTIKVTSPMNRDDDPSKCKCGKDDEIVPFTWRRGVSDKVIYDKDVATEKARKEKLPLFSSNRRTVTSSEYGGE